MTETPTPDGTGRDQREELAPLEHTLGVLDDVFYVLGTDGEIQHWNERLGEVTGYADDEIASMNAVDLFPEVERSCIREAIDEVIQTGETVVESEYLTVDGERVPYEFTGSRLTDGEGTVIGVAGIGRDISRRKEYERQLTALHDFAAELTNVKSAEEVYGRTIEASEGILEFDLSLVSVEESGVLTPVATSADISPDGVTEMPVEEGIGGKTYRTGQSFVIDDLTSHPEADPQGPYQSIISVPVGEYGNFQAVSESPEAFDESDKRLAELLITHTESALDRLRRERQLERKNDQLEKFARVASHDLKSPLNVAQGRIELARGDADDTADLDAAGRAVDRSLSLIDDLLTLAREGKQVDSLESIDLGRIADACWTNVDTAAGEFVVETDREIRADPSRLKQLLENLMRNAVEHSSTGSRTESGDAVEHSPTGNRKPAASGDAVEHGGNGVTVTIGDVDDGFYVADDGPGIPEAERENVFEAGYSTTDEGTGFGLNIVREVAGAHGWTVRITDADGGGARFEFTGVDDG